MKRGDLVRSLRNNNWAGIVLRTYHDLYGLVLVVQWPNNKIQEYRHDDLQKMETK